MSNYARTEECPPKVTQQPYGVVCGKWHRAFLVGGGPSLAHFDFELLRGQTLIAVNDAALRLPWATALISADRTWIAHREKEVLAFQGERYLVVSEGKPRPLSGVIYLRQTTDRGLSSNPGTIHVRGNSGYAALNLAFLKGARQIILLGYDFSQGHQHWFPKYPWQPSRANETYYQRWAAEFVNTLPQLRQVGVDVINANPASRIEVFPKVSLSEMEKYYAVT